MDKPEEKPVPCPECQAEKGYVRVGIYRAQCRQCHSLLKNKEVGLQDEFPPDTHTIIR